LSACEVQQRIAVERKAKWVSHRVALDFCFGGLKRPRRMMDVGSVAR